MKYELGPFDGLRKMKAETQSVDLDQLQQVKSKENIAGPQKSNTQSEVKEVSNPGDTLQPRLLLSSLQRSFLLLHYYIILLATSFHFHLTEPKCKLVYISMTEVNINVSFRVTHR